MSSSEDLTLRIGGDSSGGQQAIGQIVDAFQGLGGKLSQTGDAANTAGGHVTELGKHLEELKPSTEHAGAAFTDLRTTLTEMWEHPTKAIGDLSHALAGDLTASLGGAETALGGAVVSLGALAGAFVAAGAASYELVEHVAEVGASIERASLITGISAEHLSALKFAAEVTGGSLDQLTNMTFMLEKRMDGGGPAADKVTEALGKLGISAEDFAEMAVDEKILKISEGFRGLSEDTSKAGIVFDLFGRQGRDALPTLLQPMDELVKKAHELGVTWSDEDVKAAHDFEVQTNILHAELSRFMIDIGKDLLPMALQLAEALDRLFAKHADTSGTPLDPAAAKQASAFAAALKEDGDNAWTAAAGMDGISFSIHTQASAMPALIKAHEDAAGAVKKHIAAVKEELFVGPIYLEALKSVTPPLHDNTKAIEGINAESAKWTAGIPNLTTHLQDTHAILQPLNEVTLDFGAVTIPTLTSSLRESTSAAEEWGNVLDHALGDLPTLIEHGLTGGGGLSGALKAVESQIGSGLFKAGGPLSELGNEMTLGLSDTLGSGIGNAFGMALPGIGAIIGPMVGDLFSKIFSIGGPSEAELAGRKTEKAFEDGFGGFEKMMATVGQAYQTAGLSAQQAQADVKNLMNAETSGSAAVQASIDRINGIIQTSAADVSTAVSGILASAKTVGNNFPSALQPALAALSTLTGLTDAEKKSLIDLSTAGQPSFADLSAAAGRYGLSLDAVGGKAAQLSISTQADQIESDYKTLVTDSGADSDRVLAGMAGSLNKLVGHAMDAGAVLPTALQPLVKQLFDTGQLTDAAGNKITDLSKLKFDDTGDPLAKGMQSLTDAITRLGDLLSPTSATGLPAIARSGAAAIGDALGGIKAPQIQLHYAFVQDGDGLPREASAAAMGGFVTPYGIAQHFKDGFPGAPSGTDTIPAWLTPGESVLTRQATAMLGRNRISALNRGGDFSKLAPAAPTEITVNIDASGSFFRDREAIQELAEALVAPISQAMADHYLLVGGAINLNE